MPDHLSGMSASDDDFVQGPDDRRNVSPAVRIDVLSLGPCAYCGDPPEVVDHVHPWSRGGSDERSNLAPACWNCNAEKRDWTVNEWREARVSRGLPWPVPPKIERTRMTALHLFERADKSHLTEAEIAEGRAWIMALPGTWDCLRCEEKFVEHSTAHVDYCNPCLDELFPAVPRRRRVIVPVTR